MDKLIIPCFLYSDPAIQKAIERAKEDLNR